MSFGVDKEIIVSKLENYFENRKEQSIFLDEDDINQNDSKSKANSIIRYLKKNRWIDEEIDNDYKVKINLLDHASTIIEAFKKIVENEELEYQSMVSQIHAILLTEKFYKKPYEFIIKSVSKSMQELILGLKKLNSNIKKYIENITDDKSAGEIIEEFFTYSEEVWSRAYHRIKTSDNISFFRTSIIENLEKIFEKDIFEQAVIGYMEIEEEDNRDTAEELLKEKIIGIINAFNSYDDIINDIDNKNSKYIRSAVARAEFLLNNTNNAEGKIYKILNNRVSDINEGNLDIMDYETLNNLNLFNLFPQSFIDSDSLYTVRIKKEIELPTDIEKKKEMSDDERENLLKRLQYKNERRFSRKNIDNFVKNHLKEKSQTYASTLPMKNKRDMIRMIFISMYGHGNKSSFEIKYTNNLINKDKVTFHDFIIKLKDR